ncbi:MAG: phosphoribosylamine--glycine ligase [Micavibrio aeruginosavorus]|uniref:Phosphoribosylamine--glycine ligase n=1 Tax=Micavibrio aeruginosavorus TaxID=349221 RepID=A0A2W5N6K6_9BACT|nr:MAG: phosphoribosylamine--glycine ligase [Micavibrio aeruginosavorus]
MKVLLIGSGGREHALAWKIAASPKCSKLYCAPGNPGIADVAELCPVSVDDISGLVKLAQDLAIDFVVVGPEGPLVAGLVDALEASGIPAFGPKKDAAQLEGSKGFTKDLCSKYDIPTAGYGRFADAAKAEEFIRKTGAPIVVKADGLAAGKGVIIASTVDEAVAAVQDMLAGNAFGAAGHEVVVEEYMDGEELSFFALCDGTTVLPFTSAQDHKRVGEGDTGLNTGGMGAYSPAHFMDYDLQQKIMQRIILPTAKGMAKDGHPFQGVFFAGIMVVKDDPYLIEYNARFGDPETQPMMMRLENDLLELLHACATGKLDAHPSLTFSDKAAMGVVLAAKGYPGSYAKGGSIKGIDSADALSETKVFHAGTSKNTAGDLVSSGGRVLCVTALADTIAEAQQKAYQAVDKIDFADGFCRRDIGWRAIKAGKSKAA